MATTHKLKTWRQYFEAVERCEKTFQVRRDDRGFQKGDRVVLQEVKAPGELCAYRPTGRKMEFEIGWVLTGGHFGLEPGYVAFSLVPLSPDGRR